MPDGTPWLKENENYRSINVEEQTGRGDSILQFYRRLIELRKDPQYEDSLIYGACIPYLRGQRNLMAYLRKGGYQTLLVVGNFQEEPQEVTLPEAYETVLLNNMDCFHEHDRTI